jgi:hypothetical protein
MGSSTQARLAKQRSDKERSGFAGVDGYGMRCKGAVRLRRLDWSGAASPARVGNGMQRIGTAGQERIRRVGDGLVGTSRRGAVCGAAEGSGEIRPVTEWSGRRGARRSDRVGRATVSQARSAADSGAEERSRRRGMVRPVLGRTGAAGQARLERCDGSGSGLVASRRHGLRRKRWERCGASAQAWMVEELPAKVVSGMVSSGRPGPSCSGAVSEGTGWSGRRRSDRSRRERPASERQSWMS